MEYSNTSPLSPEELKELERFKILIERAAADGRITRQEIAEIRATIQAQDKVTAQEYELCRKLAEQVEQGELEYEWRSPDQ